MGEEQILKKSGKNALKAQIAQEKKIRDKEAELRDEKGGEALDINDYERLLVADKDQSFLWIQYMAMILDKLDIDAARRIAQRAIKSVSMSNDADKLNIWIAYMNMESQFGTQESLEQVVKQALEVNDRQKVYLQLISIYKQSDKFSTLRRSTRSSAKSTTLRLKSGPLTSSSFSKPMKSLETSLPPRLSYPGLYRPYPVPATLT